MIRCLSQIQSGIIVQTNQRKTELFVFCIDSYLDGFYGKDWHGRTGNCLQLYLKNQAKVSGKIYNRKIL